MTQIELDTMDRPSKSIECSNSVSSKRPYPKAVFFIIATELSERFSYYGMRAVLTIYMRNMLQFTEDQATTLYHTFLLLCYGLPVVWGIIADSFLGKYTTVWIVSICFAFGNIVLMLSSIPPLHLPAIPLAMAGLLLMSIGTGGMKPCVAPFGGEQFVLPQQEKQMQQFFSVFFFAMTVGNMISTVITPVFRRDVHCFDMDSCYPLAFGIPAIIMVLAVVTFVSGKPLYKIKKPPGNVLVQVVRCITYALRKEKSPQDAKRHWLDRASDKYNASLIDDIKGLLRVLVYYLPIPMFFALYEQLGSRWTLQATRMTGNLGSYTIKPDQMQVCNAILMFIFIPIFQMVVYPLFAKCNLLKRPLQRMGIGGFLAAASFCVAGIVETQIEKSYYTPPAPMTSHVDFINTLPCSIAIKSIGINVSEVSPNEAAKIVFSDRLISDVVITVNSSCSLEFNSSKQKMEWKGQIKLIPESLQSVIVYKANNGSVAVINDIQREDFKKSNEGNAKLRVRVIGLNDLNTNASDLSTLSIALISSHQKSQMPIKIPGNKEFLIIPQAFSEIHPDVYFISYNLTRADRNQTLAGSLGEVKLQNGASYLLIVLFPEGAKPNATAQAQLVALTIQNDVHMLWLLPQYILMAWAEIFFIVSGMEFSFTQAPASMKSVLQSLWHLMNAFGNVVVILSAQVKHGHSSQATEFFGFSGAMFLDTIIFCLLAMRYKYVVIDSKDIEDKNANHN